MLNIAIVGMGGIGNTHARCYQHNKNTRIVAVCDAIEDKAQKAATLYDCPAFGSVGEMLKASVKIDAVSVCTAGVENGSHHFEPTMALLKAGIPVLGEKPISNRIDEARKMVAAAKRKKIPYAINLNHRFTPAARRAREWIDQGRLGELNMIHMKLWINNPNESSPYFHLRALHPHSVDVMRFFAGDVKKVQAFLKKGKGRKTWSNAQINLLFANGVIGHLVGSYDAGGSYGLESCEIVGCQGRVVIENACEKLVYSPRFSPEVETFDCLGGMRGFGETFQSRIDAWVEQLIKKSSPEQIDGKAEDALKAQLIIEGAIESWETGKIVSIR